MNVRGSTIISFILLHGVSYNNFDINLNVGLTDNIAKVSLNTLDCLIYSIYVDDRLCTQCYEFRTFVKHAARI